MLIITDKQLKQLKLKPYAVRLYITENSSPKCFMVMAESEVEAESQVVINSPFTKEPYLRVTAEAWMGDFYSFTYEAGVGDDVISREEVKEDITDRLTQVIGWIDARKDLDMCSDLAIVQNDLQELLAVVDGDL